MKTIIRGGVALGVLVTIWTYIFGMTGMHRNLGSQMAFPIVATFIEIVVLIWALRRTAAEGRRWFGQVSAGTMLAFVGGCLIFATSFFYVSSIHPTFFAEANAAADAAYRAKGMDDATIQKLLEQQEPLQSPGMQAIMGFCMTVITGLVASMIIGAFIKSKTPKAA